MVPGTVISLDDLDGAMSANSALYPRFFLLEQLFGRDLSRGSVLTHVGHRHGRVAHENRGHPGMLLGGRRRGRS